MFLHKNNQDDAEEANATSLDFYQPRSDETRKHYESLLTRLRKLGADNANDISSLEELADDVIDICKNVDIAFVDRKNELEDLVGIKISADDVRQISQLCEKLDDYVQSTTRQTLLDRQRKQQENGDDGESDDEDDDDDDDDASARNKSNKLFSFAMAEDTTTNKHKSKMFGDDNEEFDDGDFVDDVLLGGDNNNNKQNRNTKNNNNNKNTVMKSAYLRNSHFHPLSMTSTFLTDTFTTLFPDRMAPDRMLLEEELKKQLGNPRVSDEQLSSVLSMQINPESREDVTKFLNEVYYHRWHTHYGLLLASASSSLNNNNNNNEDENNNNSEVTKESIIEELRENANAKIKPGDATGFALRQKIRGVLKLVSKAVRDQFEEDENELMNNNNNNNNNLDEGDNNNEKDALSDYLMNQEDGVNNNNNRRPRLQRRGTDLNIVDFSIHHPMGKNTTTNATKTSGGSSKDLGTLPKGTQMKQHEKFSEVIVPEPQQVFTPDNERIRIDIGFPEWAQSGFNADVKCLNPMQSKVYRTVWESDRNCLVCAPTGAGKTNVAVMACLRAIDRYAQFSDGSEDAQLREDDDDDAGRNNFNKNNKNNSSKRQIRYVGPGTGWKIIYIAPMKALASEVAGKLGKALEGLGVQVAQLSGDSSLSQQEMKNIHVLVATPEKWDIVSRKTLDLGAAAEVKLIIFDEIHMLHSERGAVLESIAARTLQQVERTCEPVRLVGLSATLPNYEDVAQFLRVNAAKGDLYYFHGGYRPCPLRQTFCCPSSSSGNNNNTKLSKRNATSLEELTYLKIQEMLPLGQIMVFVHSRKDTVRTANYIIKMACDSGFDSALKKSVQDVNDFRGVSNEGLKAVLPSGLGVHHAGLKVEDRRLVEQLFMDRRLSVLVCTATLAWGVNLPAHTVIIKGTKIYSASNGGWTDLSILDTLQMFGRAGRPDLDTSGEAVILTADSDNLAKYLRFLTVQDPVESHLLLKLMESVNAEVSLGSVSNMRQCVKWFKFTWYYTRMLRAPSRLYGILDSDRAADPTLTQLVEDLCHTALKKLDQCRLVVYDDNEGTVHPTDLGRITSFFNLSFATTTNIVSKLREDMHEHEIFEVFASCAEFANITPKTEELEELRAWRKKCPIPIANQDERDGAVKVNILAQIAISNGRLDGRNLATDLELIKDADSTRISKAIHEIALVKGWAHTASLALQFHQQLIRRQWAAQSPLRQFPFSQVPAEGIRRLEAARVDWNRVKASDSRELQQFISDPNTAEIIESFVKKIPQLAFVNVVAVAQSRSFLKLEIALEPDFEFDEELHPTDVPINFLLTVEDGDCTNILFQERIAMSRRAIENGELVTVPCFARLRDPKPASYFARCVALDWLGSTTLHPIDLRKLAQPDAAQPPTKPAVAPSDPDQYYPHINNQHDHNALFGADLQEWNLCQLTAFPSLFNRRGNTFVSTNLGSGRQFMHALVVAQFLENWDDMQNAKQDSALKNNMAANLPPNFLASVFSGRLLFVSPSDDCAQRRFNYFLQAMKEIDAQRVSEGQDARKTRVKFLSGIPSVDSQFVFPPSSSASPLIVVSSPIRLLRLSAASYDEIFEAFDVVIFDHLHTISHTPFPKAGNQDAGSFSPKKLKNLRNKNQDGAQKEADDENENDQEDGDEEYENLSNDQCFDFSASPNSSLWNTASEGGSIRYAEVVQRFVENQTRRNKQVMSTLQKLSTNNINVVATTLLSSLFLSRLVGFSSISSHADSILAKFLKCSNSNNNNNTSSENDQEKEAPAILQLSRANFTREQRTIQLQVQEIPKHEDREAAATNHVFRLLTEKAYVASSILIFTPTQRHAEIMAETLMTQFRSEEMILHPHLVNTSKKAAALKNSNNNNDFNFGAGIANNSDAAENNNHDDNDKSNSQLLQDPLLQEYCPSGVAIITPQTSLHDINIIISTAKIHAKMVCFAPMSVANRLASSFFEFCFIPFSQIPRLVGIAGLVGQSTSSQQPLVDVDVPTMLQMATRSRVRSLLWCPTVRQLFWLRALTEALPTLPLLSVSLCPSYRPFLRSYKDDEEKLAAEMMPHFVAENIIEYCFSEICKINNSNNNNAGDDSSSRNAVVVAIDDQAIFGRIQKHIVFLAAKHSPFAYGLPGAEPNDILDFFSLVVEKVVARLLGLRAVRKQILNPNQEMNNNEDAGQNDANEEIISFTPSLHGEIIERYQLSSIDCGRLVDFFSLSDPFNCSEASLLLLACKLSCVANFSSVAVSPSPAERNTLKKLCSFFSSSSSSSSSSSNQDFEFKSLISNADQFVSTSSGKAFLLVLLFCSGRLISPEQGMLSSSKNGKLQPSQCLTDAFQNVLKYFKDQEFHVLDHLFFSNNNNNNQNKSIFFTSSPPTHEWIVQLSQVLENLIAVFPAILEFCSKKNSLYLKTGVSVFRKIICGVPLSFSTGNNNNKNFSNSPLSQLPGFEKNSPRLLFATQECNISTPDQIAGADEEVQSKLFDGLSDSTIENIADWCNSVPVIETTAFAKFDEESGLVAIRCVVESAVEDETKKTLPVIACTPRLTHLMRLVGKQTMTNAQEGEDDGKAQVAATSAPTVAIPTKFLICVVLEGSPNVVRASRIVSLMNVREIVDLRFRINNSNNNMKNNTKIMVKVQSLAYQVDSECSCQI